MEKYLKRHESWVRSQIEALDDPAELTELEAFHGQQIGFMQHERLVHLIVTMFVLLFMLLTMGFAYFEPGWPSLAMAALLLILSVAYILHYFRLENGVQRWYHLAARIHGKLGRVSLQQEE